MLISIEHLTKHQNVKCIVKDVNLAVEDHDKIALIGVNGTGKTTLLRIIAGIETYEKGSIIKKNGLRISYLPQEPEFTENDTILHQIMRMDKEIQEFEAKSILGKLKLHDCSLRINVLSGGQRKRVALARALLKPCDLLILDEPTNHLDNTMIEWLEKYLMKFNKGLLMVTHDRYFLERVCKKMVEINQTHLYTYDANYTQYLELKTQREENEQANERKRQSILRKELIWVRAGVQARGTKSKERLDRFHKLSEMEKPKANGTITLDTRTARLGKKTIEADTISKGFDGNVLFHNFSYNFMRNDRVGIIGPNGCGKSTLLHVLAQEIATDSGTITHGETVKIAYFKQGYEDIDLTMKIIDYISEQGNAIKTAEGTYTASQMLERFMFDSKQQYTTIARLSGGERRRLYLLKVLMSEPNILFLDEPTNDLDIQTLQILEDYLDDFQGALIVVSHDRYFLDRICDKLFIFQANKEIKQFIGGYSAYMEVDDMQGAKRKYEDKKATEKIHVIPRFTSKEKQELATIDTDMEKIQQSLDTIDALMEQNAQDFIKLQELSYERTKLEQALEEKMERWMYLTEKKQEIEDLKKTNT